MAGCGEVEHCKEVEELGCLNSLPLVDGSCLFDLVPRKGRCVKPGSEADQCSLCGEGDLCIPESNKCVNFCERPAILPSSVPSPEPIYCVATRDPAMPDANPMLSFEEVCLRRCRLQCQRQAQYCGSEGRCPDGYCDRPEVQLKCATDCPPTAVGARDLACLTLRCEDVRRSGCDSKLSCPNGVKPDCANLTCTNDCMYEGEGLAGDGQCDDGDPASADTPLCGWGSDCIDCGPRLGTRSEPSYVGDICAFNANCAGWTGSPVSGEAWCVGQQRSIPGLARCMADCSRGQPCPEAFGCAEVTFDDGMGGQAAIIEAGLSSKACIPLMCQ